MLCKQWEIVANKFKDPVEMTDHSHSTWYSSVVLVVKFYGSIQFCTDYWKVNKLAEFYVSG